MFTWICPKCGAEVPPAYDECPRCSPPKARTPEAPTVSAPASAPPAERVAAPAPVVETATATEPPPPPPVAPPPVAPPPPGTNTRVYERPAAAIEGVPSYLAPPAVAAKKPFPAWMAAVITAGGMVLLLAILYWIIPSRHNGRTTAAATPEQTAQLENVGQTKPGDSPYTKDLEVAGFRISEDKTQRVQIRFLVINHSGAELPPLKGQISLKAGAANSIIDFPFTLPSMGPYESREITSSTKTNVRAYELPDWQFVKPEFWVTESQR